MCPLKRIFPVLTRGTGKYFFTISYKMEGGNDVGTRLDRYQLLIGWLLCCCFLAVHSRKTAIQQQADKNKERRK
jgi:hypothetical protein